MAEDHILTTFEGACRKSGLRFTHQRLEVYRELACAKDHPSAEMLHQRLRNRLPTISLDTVYRTLSTLVRHALVHRVETVESTGRFEVAFRLHHHLICSRCNRITDFDWDHVENIPLPEETAGWGRIDSKSVVIYGVCTACMAHDAQE